MINYERIDENIFRILYKGKAYLYLYRRNLLRPEEEGFSPEDLEGPEGIRAIIQPREWTTDQPFFTIGVTSTCNLHCSYCHVAGGDYTATLTEPMIGSLKRQIALTLANKPESMKITFHGDGESLTHPEIIKSFLDYIDAIKGPVKCYTSLASNGTLINERTADLVKRLSSVQISMDGIPALHDVSRGSSDLTIKGIQMLMELKVPFAIRSTLTKATLETLPEFIDFLADLIKPHEDDPVELSVGMLYDGERKIEDSLRTSPEEFVVKFLEARDYARTRNVSLSTAVAHVSAPQNDFCSATQGALFTSSGLVSSCTRVTRKENQHASRFIYGEFDPVSQKYIIDREKYAALQELRYVPEECEQCPALSLCGGSTCYVERGPDHCYARSRLLMVERLRLAGIK